MFIITSKVVPCGGNLFCSPHTESKFDVFFKTAQMNEFRCIKVGVDIKKAEEKKKTSGGNSGI